MRVRRLLSVVALGALLANSSVVFAQQPSPNPSGHQSKPSGDQSKKAQDIPEGKLNAAAAALAAVSQVHQDYEKRIASASPNDQKRIVAEGNKALQKAITDKGLSPDEYNSILEVARNDPDFKAKLIQRVESVQHP